MRSNSRSSFSAAKLLLEKGWLDKDSASNAKKKLEAKEQEEEDRQALRLIGDDASRLGIKIN
jgi:predicted solute-binding protein